MDRKIEITVKESSENNLKRKKIELTREKIKPNIKTILLDRKKNRAIVEQEEGKQDGCAFDTDNTFRRIPEMY